MPLFCLTHASCACAASHTQLYGPCPSSASHMPHVHARLRTHSWHGSLPHTCLMRMRGFAGDVWAPPALLPARDRVARDPVLPQRRLPLDLHGSLCSTRTRARARPHTHTHAHAHTKPPSLPPPSPPPSPLSPYLSVSPFLPSTPVPLSTPIHLASFLSVRVSIAVPPPPPHHRHALPQDTSACTRARTRKTTHRARTYTRGRLAFMRCAVL